MITGIMATITELKALAQGVLDELWAEKSIPFKLNVGKIIEEPQAYTIHFYDSRLHSVSVPLTDGRAFRNLVRAAVLEQVQMLNGPPGQTD